MKLWDSLKVWQKTLLVTGIILCVILIVEVILFASIWFSSVQQGLTVFAQVDQPHLVVTRGDNISVEFSYGVSNAPFCNEICNWTIQDVSHQETLAHGSSSFGDSHTITTSLQASDQALQTSAYQFILACKNTPTLRCQRDFDEQIAVATQTVTTQYTSTEEDIREELKGHLPLLEEQVGMHLAQLLELTQIKDERIGAIHNASRQERVDLLRSIDDLHLALDNNISRAPLIVRTLEKNQSIQEYLTLVADETLAIRAYDELLLAEEKQEAARILANDSERRELDQRTVQAVQSRKAFYQTAPKDAKLAFDQLIQTTQNILSYDHLASRNLLTTITLAEYNISKQLCKAQNTTCTKLRILTSNSSLQLANNLRSACQTLYLSELQFNALNSTNHTNSDAYSTLCAFPNQSEIFPKSPIPILPKLTQTPIEITFSLPSSTCCTSTCGQCSNAPITILFVHGHAFSQSATPEYSVQAFPKLALTFQEKYGVLYRGNVFPEEDIPVPLGSLSSVTSTYYVNTFAEEGIIQRIPRKSESIEVYALRLHETIQALDNSEKVIIVAHSMGGLVSRQYISVFGTSKVAGLVMIGTPNNGIAEDVAQFCGVVGSTTECEQMTAGSVFLRKLNSQPLPDIPILTIAGEGCRPAFDGIVSTQSVELRHAQNEIIQGSCKDRELHSDLLDPDLYPQVGMRIWEFISDDILAQ